LTRAGPGLEAVPVATSSERVVRPPVPGALRAAVVVGLVVVLAVNLHGASALAATGVTWWGDHEEAYGRDVADLPASVPDWLAGASSVVSVVAVLLAPLVALLGLPGSLLLAREEWRHGRRVAPSTAVAVVLTAALAVLALMWSAELTTWTID
jgi:hypothetical protein